MILENITIIINKEKVRAYSLGRQLVTYCHEHGLKTALLPADAAFLGYPDHSRSLEDLKEWSDLVISLGGDGTLLGAARLFASAGVPILGINLGHLGFLTAAEPEHMEQVVLDLIAGRCSLEERYLLEAQIYRRGQVIGKFSALNDVVITKSAFTRIQVTCYVGNEYFATYRGDGVIIATATGSTAYSLSAGGPIVSPALDCLIITPICPHALGARSLVISGKETFQAVVASFKGDIVLAADGQKAILLEQGDKVQVMLAKERVKFVRLSGQEFYHAMRTRLQDNSFKLPEEEKRVDE